MELVKDFSMPVCSVPLFPVISRRSEQKLSATKGSNESEKKEGNFRGKIRLGADNGPNEKERFQCQSHASTNVYEEKNEEKRKQRTMCNHRLHCELLTCKI